MENPAPKPLEPQQAEQFRAMLEQFGVLPAQAMVPVVPLVDRVREMVEDGAVLVMAPGAARGPAVGTTCAYTGLTYDEFYVIRTKGWVTNEGEMLMGPFKDWASTNENGKGRAVIHFSVPKLLEYLAGVYRISERRREAKRVAAESAAADRSADGEAAAA